MLKNRKVISICLCLGILVSILNPMTLSFADEIADNLMESSNVPTEYEELVDGNQKNATEEQLKNLLDNKQLEIDVESVYSPFKDEFNEIKLKSTENRLHRLRSEDTYNYTKLDIEQLILGGTSIEDIYLSDQVGNEWLIPPRELVQMKKQHSSSWKEIEISIKNEKEKQLDLLLTKHHKLKSKIMNIKMNTAERLEILQVVEKKGEKTLSQAIKMYEKEGFNRIKQVKEGQIELNSELFDESAISYAGELEPSDSTDSEVNDLQPQEVN